MNVSIPCRIGDTVYTVRKYGGRNKVVAGRVSEIYFVGREMNLCIVVYHSKRGTWMKDVFPSYEEAERHMKEQK